MKSFYYIFFLLVSVFCTHSHKNIIQRINFYVVWIMHFISKMYWVNGKGTTNTSLNWLRIINILFVFLSVFNSSVLLKAQQQSRTHTHRHTISGWTLRNKFDFKVYKVWPCSSSDATFYFLVKIKMITELNYKMWEVWN